MNRPWRRSAMREPVATHKDSRLFGAVCKELLASGIPVRFRAGGRSMQPNICDGDAVVVVPIRGGEARRGDVAFTQGADGLRVHRVLRWDSANGTVVTRSDTAHQNDGPVTT